MNRLQLCELLKERRPKEFTMAAVSLRVQLQQILREKRRRVAEGTATEEEIELLKQFDG